MHYKCDSAIVRYRDTKYRDPFDKLMVHVFTFTFLPEFPDSQIPKFRDSPIISLTVNYRLHAGGETMHCLCVIAA